ncbi:transcriptional regulator ATRX homolog isoform X2 [Clinocottus analis]|uniref:transcriptional regulator ATRX homolog isoform X2 n=1 Tax=Clinocottus analis TaxID=304258 RepID=UPI0035C1CD0E
MKTEEKKSEQGFVKRKKLTKEQASLPEKKHFSAEVEKEKKSKKVDVIVIDTDMESVDGSSKPKKKKKKSQIVTESLNSSVENGNDKEISKKKKQQRTVKEIKNNSVKIKAQHVKLVEEQKDELPKKAKKRKNVLVVNAEEIEEKVKEKKKKKTTDVQITDEISITKSAKMKVTENGVKLGTLETCEVEGLKVKKKKKKCVAKEDTNILPTPQMEGNNKRSKVESGQEAENDNMLNKKKDKSTKSEIVIIDEEETELKTKGKKVKSRKVSVEVSKVEQKESKKKKKTGNSKGGEEVPLLLNCEEVEEQRSETVAMGKKKKISIKVEPVSVGTGPKKKKIKEEVEDQHESPLKDVVFLSSKTGNADEVNINQERRQALQMDIDTASQPHETKCNSKASSCSASLFGNCPRLSNFCSL